MVNLKKSSTKEKPNTECIALSHGILAEDFKQNLINLVHSHKLDIQTKAIILDAVLLSANLTAKQQTQIELNAYEKELEQNILSKKEAS